MPRPVRARAAGRGRQARRAALRLAPGHRVGSRSRRRRRAVRRAGAPGHRPRQEAREAQAGVRDVADHEHLRRRTAEGLTVALSDEDVREILRIIDEAALTELQIDTEGFSLHVRKGGGDAPAPIARPRKPPADGLATITAPMLGTFYRAEAPGKPAFVEVGARVESDTIVCIIEVMKMMNSVTAGVSGVIAEVVPANAELVE